MQIATNMLMCARTHTTHNHADRQTHTQTLAPMESITQDMPYRVTGQNVPDTLLDKTDVRSLTSII